MPPNSTTFYFSEFDEVNDRFMTLGQVLVMLRQAPAGSAGFDRALQTLKRIFPAQFAFEQEMMADCLYPKHELQTATHRTLSLQLEALLALDEDDTRRPAIEQRFLALLERHVRLEDNEMIAFLDAIEEECEQTVTTSIYRRQRQ